MNLKIKVNTGKLQCKPRFQSVIMLIHVLYPLLHLCTHIDNYLYFVMNNLSQGSSKLVSPHAGRCVTSGALITSSILNYGVYHSVPARPLLI